MFTTVKLAQFYARLLPFVSTRKSLWYDGTAQNQTY